MAKIKGKLLLVPIEKVHPNGYNYNEMDSKMLDLEKKALKQFGIVRALTVRELSDGTFEIIDGEHRYFLLKECGAKTVPVRSLGKISLNKAMALTVALDEIRGTKDFFKLAALFNSVKEYSAEQMAEILPYAAEEITAFAEASDYTIEEFDLSSFKEDMVRDSVTVPCRMKLEDAAEAEKKMSKLCSDLGIKSDKVAAEFGSLFTHLAREAAQAEAI